ncbi:hypothetical protein ACE1ET_15175 [Saccharicrinis sp. FJH62]|uniref:hypothetical protein n=1 Tax=Saccharicrinis sp. FJH62 TaxID=3344657 RepID=UPI0035D454B6
MDRKSSKKSFNRIKKMEKANLVGYLNTYSLKKDKLIFERPIFKIKDKLYWLDFRRSNDNYDNDSLLVELENEITRTIIRVNLEIELEFDNLRISGRFYLLRINKLILCGFRDEIVEQLLSKFDLMQVIKYDKELLFLQFIIFNYDNQILEKYLDLIDNDKLPQIINKVVDDEWVPFYYKVFFECLINEKFEDVKLNRSKNKELLVDEVMDYLIP